MTSSAPLAGLPLRAVLLLPKKEPQPEVRPSAANADVHMPLRGPFDERSPSPAHDTTTGVIGVMSVGRAAMTVVKIVAMSALAARAATAIEVGAGA